MYKITNSTSYLANYVNSINKFITNNNIQSIVEYNNIPDNYDIPSKDNILNTFNKAKSELAISCYLNLTDDNIYHQYFKTLFTLASKYIIICTKPENLCKYIDYINYGPNKLDNWNLLDNVELADAETTRKVGDAELYIFKCKSNLIVTLNFNNRPYIKYTKQYMEEYATKTNSVFKVIDETNIQDILNTYNIDIVECGRNNNQCYIYRILVMLYYLNIFEKIMILDDTCFIKNNCENLFDMLDEDYNILAYNEGQQPELIASAISKRDIYEKTRFKIDTNKYINCGIMLLSSRITNILNIYNVLKYIGLFKSKYPNQSFINFILQYFKVKVKYVPSAYNCMFMNNTYNNAGYRIMGKDIGTEFVLCDSNKIFHITGFYKHRLEVVIFIAKVLLTKIIPFYNSNIQIDITVIKDIIKMTTNNTKMLVFGLGHDSEMWYNINKNTYFIEDKNKNKYIDLCKNVIPTCNIIKYFYNSINVIKTFNITDNELSAYKIPHELLKLAPFDIILIDGPEGYNYKTTGRLIPYYWSTKLSGPNTIIYGDDSSRKLETYAINKYYKTNDKYIFNSRLKCTKILPTHTSS